MRTPSSSSTTTTQTAAIINSCRRAHSRTPLVTARTWALISVRFRLQLRACTDRVSINRHNRTAASIPTHKLPALPEASRTPLAGGDLASKHRWLIGFFQPRVPALGASTAGYFGTGRQQSILPPKHSDEAAEVDLSRVS